MSVTLYVCIIIHLIIGSAEVHTPRTRSSKTTLSFFRPKECDRPVAQDVVRWVVVSLAKTPFKAAQAPLETA